MSETYQRNFSASEALIEGWGNPIGVPITVPRPDGTLRETSSVHRLGLRPDVLVYLNARRWAGLGRIASMRATWYVPHEEDDVSTIGIGCKHVSSALTTDKRSPVWVERHYTLTNNLEGIRVMDLPSRHLPPDEPGIGLERPAIETDTAFVEATLAGIVQHYPRI